MNNPSTVAAQALVRADFDLPLPACISLGGDQPPITCDRLLRLLPGRRVVLSGRWSHEGQEQRVVLKLFFREKDWLKEMDGYQRLCESMITVPACLLGWEAEDKDVHALVYEYIEGQSLYSLWQEASSQEAKTAYMVQAAEVVAKLHDHGLCQTDIHLDNFMVSQNTLYTLDAGTVEQGISPLDKKTSLGNLALMLAQVPAKHDGQIAEICEAYNNTNPCVQFEPEEVKQETVKRRSLRWRHYKKKLFRSCTEFIAEKSSKRFQVWRRDCDSPALQSLLANPDAYIDVGEKLKEGNSATVAKVEVDGKKLVVKRYNLKNWRHRLSRCWRPTRAWCSWINAHLLGFSGIQTPRPIAMIEERNGPLRGRGFFIAEACDSPDMLQVVSKLETGTSRSRLEELSQQVKEVFDALWMSRIVHGDMKATNLLVTEEGISVIDLDAMVESQNPTLSKGLTKDLQRFLKNWQGETQAAFAKALQPFAELLESSTSG
ncbi:lipopolysaccharide kinase InaA family protein [Maricurvus nonylphenolicus]|uniref:phosphotransferase n=1 Tax=Maricurvus nonylphenolicus TaxID=1008307 RepID=UPI0036F23BD2